MGMPAIHGVDWGAIRLEYINSLITADELAQRHGVKPATLRQRAARGDWNADRHALSKAVTTVTQEAVLISRKTELAKFNEDDLKMAKALRGLVVRAITRASSGKNMSLSPSEIRSLAGTVSEAQRIGRLALGASTENMAHGGAGGEGPVPLTSISVAEYTDALKQAMDAF